MDWMAVRPGAVERWDDEEFDIGDFLVERLRDVTGLVHRARVLLGEADPDGLTGFDRLYDEGWMEEPPHWSGERLRAFSAAAGRVPDLLDHPGGFWRLTDETVVDLAPKLPSSSRYVEESVDVRRQAIKAEWSNAHLLHRFLARAVAAGNDVVAD